MNFDLIKLRHQNGLPFIDFAFADYMIKHHQASSQLIPLLVHLSQCTRAGHLCIQVNAHRVFPKPQEVWEVQESCTLSEEEWIEIEQLISLGVPHISSEFCISVEDKPENFVPPTPICQWKDLFYLQKHWIYEAGCLNHFQQLIHQKPLLNLDGSAIQSHVNRLVSQNSLLPEQAQAISQFDKQSLTIISGGPGTGKTYTAGLLIQVFWDSLSPNQKKSCRIALAAPTGKAAANLQKSLGKSTAHLSDFPLVMATTLHALLGFKSKNISVRPNLLNADLLIVDECSMIDIRLMFHLFQALKPGARIIMLGDPYQLPPVEAGSFFMDMTHLCPSNQLVELKKCLRSDLKEIVDFSEEIKLGNSQAALHRIQTSNSALHFQEFSDDIQPNHLYPQILEKAASYLSLLDIHTSEKEWNRFRILSPLRKGPLGVDQLNAFFYAETLKRSKHSQHLVIPIMITANDSKNELFNGDVGFLIRNKNDLDKGVQIGDYALFSGKKIPALLLPRYEYAYCLSVHKSQGSEFDHVLLLLPQGCERFGREMIYTAVTRTRQRLEIWSQPQLFKQAIEQSNQRFSRTRAERRDTDIVLSTSIKQDKQDRLQRQDKQDEIHITSTIETI